METAGGQGPTTKMRKSLQLLDKHVEVECFREIRVEHKMMFAIDCVFVG